MQQANLETRQSGAIIPPMIAEELKSAVDTLSEKERHELSCYLTKLELQKNPDYWKTIRERTNPNQSGNWVPVEEIRDHP